jgi:ubiquinone/menaquinone biosynthesis C-methylase UbiE
MVDADREVNERAGRARLVEAVRRHYAAAAADAGGACCGPGREAFGRARYTIGERREAPAAAQASLGCGSPTTAAGLREGEVVLDLGSGGGFDALLAARRVGPEGIVYGLDMTDEMLDLARRNAALAGVANVAWLRGLIEDVPLPGRSVDAVISNCVVNLSPDKERVLAEAARVLRPGGRLAIVDVVADGETGEATGGSWCGCIAGALTREELEAMLLRAGLVDVAIEATHRVHERAAAAIIRARKPEEAA